MFRSGLVAIALIAGCTLGVDGDYVAVGYAEVVSADRVAIERGPITGQGRNLDISDDAGPVVVAFEIQDGDQTYQAELTIDGDLFAMLHGSAGSGTLVIETDEGGSIEIPVRMTSHPGLASGTFDPNAHDRFEVEYVGDGGNTELSGRIVFDVVQGHC